jgi:hypothetical protein
MTPTSSLKAFKDCAFPKHSSSLLSYGYFQTSKKPSMNSKSSNQRTELFFAEPSLKEIKEIYVKIRNRHLKYGRPRKSLKFIDLEETHKLSTKPASRKPEAW